MKRYTKTICAALAITATATGITLAGMATAAAASPPDLSVLGYDTHLWPRGNCYGPLRMRLDNNPANAEEVVVTVTPTGNWGTQVCPLEIDVISVGNLEERHIWMRDGEITVPLRTGYGVNLVGLMGTIPFALWPGGTYIVKTPSMG